MTGIQDPYEDYVATMRLYNRMRSQAHKVEECPLASDPQNRNNFSSRRQSELKRMTLEKMWKYQDLIITAGARFQVLEDWDVRFGMPFTA
ncbi:hypothetical protein ACS0TY_006266 [Phlomoides rotata]